MEKNVNYNLSQNFLEVMETFLSCLKEIFKDVIKSAF